MSKPCLNMSGLTLLHFFLDQINRGYTRFEYDGYVDFCQRKHFSQAFCRIRGCGIDVQCEQKKYYLHAPTVYVVNKKP